MQAASLITDPLKSLIDLLPPDSSRIKKIASGSLYYALMLDDENVGVCAKLNNTVYAFGEKGFSNLDDPGVRIPLIAYYNALLNPHVSPDAFNDIFSHTVFDKNEHIVMIGFFRPLVAKFDAKGIPLVVFDLNHDDNRLTPVEKLEKELSLADKVIITSTTLVNNTYPGIISKVRPGAESFMLGPSSMFHPVFFQNTPMKAIYGMRFNAHSSNVLEVIENGGGTPDFSPLAQKICLLRH